MTKTEPKSDSPPAAQADPCLQARADWIEIKDSKEVNVLQGFLRSTPSTCGTQIALGEAAINSIRAAETAAKLAKEKENAEKVAAKQELTEKQVSWHGVAEFAGSWIGTGDQACKQIRLSFSLKNGFIWMSLETPGADTQNSATMISNASPPTLIADVRARTGSTRHTFTFLKNEVHASAIFQEFGGVIRNPTNCILVRG